MRELLTVVLILSKAVVLQALPTELDDLISKIAERNGSITDPNRFQVDVTSITREMDDDWHVKKETVIRKRVTKRDTLRETEILNAIRFENGKEEDITQKVIEENQKSSQRGQRKMQFSLESTPFSPKHRPHFHFLIAADSTIEDKAVKTIRVKCLAPSENYFNGTYYVDINTFSILKMNLHPSKKPGRVKEMRIEADFYEDEAGHYFIKKFWMRVYASILIKKFRFEAQEIYANYRIS